MQKSFHESGNGTRHDEHPWPYPVPGTPEHYYNGVYDTVLGARAKDLGRVAVCCSRYDFGATAPLLSNGVFPRQCWPLVDLYLGVFDWKVQRFCWPKGTSLECAELIYVKITETACVSDVLCRFKEEEEEEE